MSTRALDIASGIASVLGKMPGKAGRGALVVAGVLETISAAMKLRGESAEEIMAHIPTPPKLKTWQEIAAEADAAEVITQNEKLKPSGGAK